MRQLIQRIAISHYRKNKMEHQVWNPKYFCLLKFILFESDLICLIGLEPVDKLEGDFLEEFERLWKLKQDGLGD